MSEKGVLVDTFGHIRTHWEILERKYFVKCGHFLCPSAALGPTFFTFLNQKLKTGLRVLKYGKFRVWTLEVEPFFHKNLFLTSKSTNSLISPDTQTYQFLKFSTLISVFHTTFDRTCLRHKSSKIIIKNSVWCLGLVGAI